MVMVSHGSLLVGLLLLIDRLPAEPAARRGRGRPYVYPDHLFLKALVIMLVKHLYTRHALWRVLHEPTEPMPQVRGLLTVDGRFPSRRTFDRRLQALPETLPEQIVVL